MASELARVIEQVEKDKGIERSILISALETALLTAAKKKYGENSEIEAHFNDDLGEIELFRFKTVVETVLNPLAEIALDDAQIHDPDVSLGDSIGIKLDSSEFGRIAAQTAKQVIIQKVRDAEQDVIFNEFNIRKGEIVSGVCRRIEKGCVILDLGRTDAILPAREQIPGENFRPGDRITGYLIDVQQTTRGPKIVLSRTCPEFLMKLFSLEVPEIGEGIVQIKGAAREPGVRAKIAVFSTDPDVDCVGACVGVKGMRVQSVVQELRGEKIDIVPWDADETRFVCNALAPAEVVKVFLDEYNHSMEIVVSDTQLSLAIGKKGQNVKLAAILTGWRLDILSESKMAKRSEEAKKLLLAIEGMNDTLAQGFFHFSVTVEQIANAPENTYLEIPGMTPEKASLLKKNAALAIESGAIQKLKDQFAQEAEKKLAADKGKRFKGDAVFEKLKREVKAQQEKDHSLLQEESAKAGEEADTQSSDKTPPEAPSATE